MSRRTPPGPARSQTSTARAGTAAAEPLPPWGNGERRAAGSSFGTGTAARCRDRPDDHPPVVRPPRSHRRRSRPCVRGRDRCAPPTRGPAHLGGPLPGRGRHRPRPLGRTRASAGHLPDRSHRERGRNRGGSPRRGLSSASAYLLSPARPRRQLRSAFDRRVRHAHHQVPHPQLLFIPR